MKALCRILFSFIWLGVVHTGLGFSEDLWKTVPAPAALPKADESGLAPVNDILMYYEIYNAAGADTVLLLHGGLGSTLNWGNQVPALIETHKVVAVDSRGHGRWGRSFSRRRALCCR